MQRRFIYLLESRGQVLQLKKQGWTKVFIRPFGRWNRNLFFDKFRKFLRFWRQRNFRILSKNKFLFQTYSKKFRKNNCCKIYLFKKSPKFPENCCKISFTLRVYVHVMTQNRKKTLWTVRIWSINLPLNQKLSPHSGQSCNAY